MRERFGSDEADGRDKGVCGGYLRVLHAQALSLLFDRCDHRLDLFVTGLLSNELTEFLSFFGVRSHCE